jgi:hypothetical protein
MEAIKVLPADLADGGLRTGLLETRLHLFEFARGFEIVDDPSQCIDVLRETDAL